MSRRPAVLTLAAEWERIAPGIVENWAETDAAARNHWLGLFYMAARATLNLLERGADPATLEAECTRFAVALVRDAHNG